MKTFEVKTVVGPNKFETTEIQAEKVGANGSMYELSTYEAGLVYSVKLDYLVSVKQINYENA